MDFKDKVVIITGASSEIGAATAVEFAKLGGVLAIVDRNLDNLRETAEQCWNAKHREPLLIQADIMKEHDVKKIIANTVARFGKINVLVNNASMMENGSIEDTSLQQFDRVMNTNVRSVYHLTMLAVPHLVKTKGVIVNLSSVWGLRPFPGNLAYNMSKAAIDQFTKCVSLELAPKGVRVNSVNPDIVISDQMHGGMNEEVYESSKKTHLSEGAGEVQEAVAAVLFLASDISSFITGCNLPVDGGRPCLAKKK